MSAVQIVHTHSERKMPPSANLPTGYISCWVPGDIRSYPFNDLYSHELYTGENISKIVVYQFEHITTIDGICDYDLFFGVGFHGLKGAVKHYSA